MRGEKKMSQFEASTLAAMKTAGAGIPVFVAGTSNEQIPAENFASADDITSIWATIGNVESLLEAL